MKKRIALVSAALLAVSLSLTACGGGTTNTGGATTAPTADGGSASAGTTLTIGSLYEHDGFDPLNPLSASANGERLVPVFDTLLRVDTSGAAVGQLAEGMTSEDGLVWTLTLRDGVTFTDGTPLDAEAVIYNVGRHSAEDSPSSSKYLLSTVVSMEAPDATTVVFTLSSANFSFPYLFTSSGAVGLIGSPTALEADAEGFNRAPIGAGPYIVEEWVADDHVTMTANPDYFAGEPAIKTLTYKVLPDPQSRENALVTGQIDITSISGDFTKVAADPNLTVQDGGSRGGLALLPNTSAAPLDDDRVREAIQLAFDPKNSKAVLFGTSDVWDGVLGCVPFGAGDQCEPTTVKPDLEKAKKLIAEYAAEGNAVDIEILANTFLQTQAQYVDQVLKSIGMTSTIKTVSPGEHIPALYSGEYQLGMWQMVPFESFYPLGYTIFSGTARNVIKHDDAAFDAALEQGVNAATLDERNEGLRTVQTIWNDEAYVTWLGPLPQFIVTNKNVDMGDGYLGGFAFYPADITVSGQ